MKNAVTLFFILFLIACEKLDHPMESYTVRIDTGSDYYGCSAVKLTDSVLLTAAHCIVDDSVRSIKLNGRKTGIEKIIVHEDYQPLPIVRSDIALIFLNRENFQPNFMISEGTHIIGNQFESVVVEGNTKKLKKHQFEEFDTDRLIVSDIGKGVCKGNSGAPVYTKQGEKFELVGVLSGITKERNGCNVNGLTLVVDASYFRDWINVQIDKFIGEQ